MKYILILFLMLGACAKNGSDGAAGPAGPQGVAGINGTNGTNGNNGANGTDNKIIGTIHCSGFVANTGFWSNTNISYYLAYFASRDIFVSLQVNGLQQFNVSNSMMYSNNQNGSINGFISTMIDNSNWVEITLDSNTIINVEFKGDNPAVFNNTIICNVVNF